MAITMRFKKVRILLTCLSASFPGIPIAAVAGTDSGFYLDAGVGDARVENSKSDLQALEAANGIEIFIKRKSKCENTVDY